MNDIPVALIESEDVVDVEDIITVLVVKSIVLCSLGRFCKTPPWIPGRLVLKFVITQTIRRREMHRQRLQWL